MRAMILVSFRNIAAHRLRFALTTFAVLLGVSFVVGSFVLTDGLRATFDNIVADANADLDVQIQAKSGFEEVQFTDRPIDEALVDVVAAVDGVELAVAGTQSAKIVPVTASGDPI
ncbi:MAG: ABC transporter permease, partial [Actinomycetia bacterium]|nr:ABC transporter permease [Actinomycetes bacterium]